MKTIVIATGGFDPVHSGHIAYLRAARELGDQLIVGVNSDDWLVRKKGRAFMPYQERVQVVANLSFVDRVIEYNDDDGSSRDAILQVRAQHPAAHIIFANGGDRVSANIPEMDVADGNLEFRFAVGGANKANSSSWILEEWKAPRTERPWGYYRVLHTPNPRVKVKELTVNPGCSLSMQRHRYRSEHWFVAEGIARVLTVNMASTDVEDMGQYIAHQALHIRDNEWHQLCNDSQTQPLKVIEIQYGEQTEENDIERRE
jgi:D-beta-D-heptose 7-phosphate kinase/D-beta-D-heptose 1-phosphate adenosyltransferase